MSISGISDKCILIILDGFGFNPEEESSAIKHAKTPYFDYLNAHYPNTLIQPGGEAVGLPKGITGNSEVGHMNLGAGRPVRQDLVRINESIQNNEFKSRPEFLKLIEKAKSGTGRIHLMGLLSDGGVHSHIDHLLYIHQALEKEGIETHGHFFMDGRDTPKNCGGKYLEQIQEAGIKVGSIQGRSIGMDRDRRWEKIEACYETLTGKVSLCEMAPLDYLKSEYENDRFDEFIAPALFSQESAIKEGDCIFFFNFRPDRAIQITEAFNLENFEHFKRDIKPGHFLCMTPYIPDEMPLPILFDKEKLSGTLTEYLSSLGLKQLKIAETEKYAHVTYFFNGGEKTPFKGEDHLLIPSPKHVATYDEAPEMSAPMVTEKLTEVISNDQYDFIVVNYANGDMVGHTGNFEAAVKAVETLDQNLKKLVGLCEEKGVCALITADHGNCDQMRHKDGLPHTAHTNSVVPFYVVHPSLKSTTLPKKENCALKDVAPTVLKVLGINPPESFKGFPIFD